jgi:hypothetical protein
VNFKEHYLNQTGINFEFDAETFNVDIYGVDHPDAEAVEIEQTNFIATRFSFPYKGAHISGKLSAYAGFIEHHRLGETELRDLMPAVTAACGFPIDMDEVGAM